MKREVRDDGVLLTMGDYYGTLAAARCYGRAGIPVYLAEANRLTQTHWSRYVARSVRAPSLADLDAFGAWLLEFGRAHRGAFLYPTSDDMAWLLASRADALREHYRMYQPKLSTIMSLLDKRRLYEACIALDIDIPDTLFPDSESSLADMIARMAMPTLIKPRTQMLLDSKLKGRLVTDRDELRREYHAFREKNTYGRELLAYDASISWPMLQRYHPEAKIDTYSLAGFIDEAGEVFVVRAARKIFQRPRQLGVGLCFVSEPVREDLSRKVYELCRRVGYFGAFESEFVHVDGRHLLIDFNPRFYGQMGFEVARDMPLPTLVYHAAHGLRGDALRAAVVQREGTPNGSAYHFSNRWVLELVMLTQSLSGRLDAHERKALKDILDNPSSRYIDAVNDEADRGPFVADVLLNVKHFARHPRDFVRKFFLDA